MRELISTSDVSYAESIRIALEAHDIEVEVSGPQVYSPLGGGVGNSMTVFVRHDKDYDRAHALLKEIIHSSSTMSISRKDVKRGLHFLWKAALALALLAAYWYRRSR